MEGFRLSEQAARSTAKVVNAALRESSMKPRERSKKKPPPGTRYQGILATDLDAPTDGMTSPTTADVIVWQPVAGSGVPPAMAAGFTVPGVVNRDPSLSGAAGAYCRIEWLNGEWSFYWVGC